MKKIVERLLIFIIGIPAVFALVFFLPFCRHLPLNIMVVFFSAVGAMEFSAMLNRKQIHVTKIEAFILGALAPLAVTMTVSLNFPEWIIPVILMTGASWAILSLVFTRSTNIENIIYRLAGCILVIVYPGIFMIWIIKMNTWGISGAIFLFLLITFFNDSAAWLAGSLLGKSNRGIIPVSPNKSMAGFIGGLVGSVVVAAGAAFLFPSFFGLLEYTPDLLLKAIILGLCTGIFATLGDLSESAIKRCSDIKDSGNVILGRGGVLDSVDSVAIAAPVFYFVYNVFFFSL
jgi:phosphatidate cytidylyltransferase